MTKEELMSYAREWVESRVMDVDEALAATDSAIYHFVDVYYPGGWRGFTDDHAY